MAQPLQRVAARAHPFLAVRAGVRARGWSRRCTFPAIRCSPTTRCSTSIPDEKARAAAGLGVRLGDDDSRARRSATASTSCCAAATRRRWKLPREASRHEPAHHLVADRRAVPAHRPRRGSSPRTSRRPASPASAITIDGPRHRRRRQAGQRRASSRSGRPTRTASTRIPEDAQDKPLEPGFRGFGRVPTDDDGSFRFTTIKPGRVPGPGRRAAGAALVVTIFMRGLLKHLITRIYFPGRAGERRRPGAEARARGAARDADRASAHAGRARRARVERRSCRARTRRCSSITEHARIMDREHSRRIERRRTSFATPARSAVHDGGDARDLLRSRPAAGHARLRGGARARRGARRRASPPRRRRRSARSVAPSCFDVDALARAAAHAGNPAIPLVKALTALRRGAATPRRRASCTGARPARTRWTPGSCCSCAPRST